MNNKLVAITGFILVIISLLATVCLFAFQDGIRKIDWLDLESLARGSMAICFIGTALGWTSYRNSTGKVAGILGSLVLCFYVYQLFSSGDSAAKPVVEQPQSKIEVDQDVLAEITVGMAESDLLEKLKQNMTRHAILTYVGTGNHRLYCQFPNDQQITFEIEGPYSAGKVSIIGQIGPLEDWEKVAGIEIMSD